MNWKIYATRKNILVAVLILLVFAFIVIKSCSNSSSPDSKLQDTIDAAITRRVAEFENKIKAKDEQIKGIEESIKMNNARIVISEEKYKVIAKKIADLKKERENVKPPQSNTERRARFNTAGFPMLPIK
jgi:peptidoglycan hydrolase CwlO-like protein